MKAYYYNSQDQPVGDNSPTNQYKINIQAWVNEPNN
jgi:hypothetical protein